MLSSPLEQALKVSQQAGGTVVCISPISYGAAVPFLIQWIEARLARGAKIDLVVPQQLDPPFEIQHPHLHLYQPPTLRVPRLVQRFWSLVWMIRKTRALIHNSAGVSGVFGFSQLGLILAWLGVTFSDQRLVYLNDELWFNDHEPVPFYHLRKCLEILACRRAHTVVTQDRDRGRLLAAINRFSPVKLCFLPNSVRGPGAPRRTHVLHDLLGSPHDRRIVLWMGAVSEGDGALEIARQAVHWPADYLFVIHFRSKSFSAYKLKLQALAGQGSNRIVAHSFAPHEVEDAYASAHVGVVFYPNRGLNADYIGASSGKLNLFLKAGVPCLVSRSRGLRWAVRQAGCVAIPNTNNLLLAVRNLETNYEERTAQAVATYNSRLLFEPAFERLEARISLHASQSQVEFKS